LQFRSVKRVHSRIGLGVLFLVLLLALSYFVTFSGAEAQQPAYAVQGAYVYYNVQGGSIAFMSGVNGSLIYKVTGVFPNNTMSVQVLANMTEGNEVPISYQVLNYTDNIFEPTTFPAVPLANLTANSMLVFENVKCSFVKYQSIPLTPGQFNTSEYQGVDKNGTTYTFFFDRTTGVAVQMYTNQGVAIQLESSNIVTPDGPANSVSQVLPYYEDFAAALAFGVLVFGGAYWYYSRKNKKLVVNKPNGKS
jgi:hypothetical protein